MSEMNSESSEAEVKEVKITLVGAGTCFKTYANYGNVMATPFDIQLIFADIAEMGPEGAIAKAEARIIMAPEHAALLATALQKRIEAFVRMNGSLRPVARPPTEPVHPPSK